MRRYRGSAIGIILLATTFGISRAESTGKVMIYMEEDFKGNSYPLALGEYDFNDDQYLYHSISSIKVPSGYTVTLFEQKGFKGRSAVIKKDSPRLLGSDGQSFNNSAASILVEKEGNVHQEEAVQNHEDKGEYSNPEPHVVKLMKRRIMDNNLAGVKELVEGGYPLNKPGKYDASEGGRELENEFYPLQWACWTNPYHQKTEIITYLAAKGADPFLYPRGREYGRPRTSPSAFVNCLCMAAEGKELTPVVRNLVMQWIERATTEQVNLSAGSTKRTALHWAAYWGDVEIVWALLRKGARNDIMVPADWTPGLASDYARLQGHNELAYEIEGKDFSEYKRTLNYAVQQNDFDRVRKLIASGARVTDPDKSSRLTALHYAARPANLKMVQLLVESGADINAVDFRQWSALTMALQDRNRELVTYLVHAGATANHAQDVGCASGRSEYWYLVATAYQNPAFYDLAALQVKRNAVNWPEEAYTVAYLRTGNQGAAELIEALVNRGASLTQEEYDFYKKEATPEMFQRIKPFLDKGLRQKAARSAGPVTRDPKDSRFREDLDKNGLPNVNGID